MLYLIDGDALLYRAANAIPLFTNSRGLPINGLHGFVSMIHLLLRESHPTHVAVAFTADPPLRKHALDPDYKIKAALLRLFPTVELLLDNLEQVTIIGARPRLEPMRERILLNKTLALPAKVSLKKRLDLRIGAPRTRCCKTSQSRPVSAGYPRRRSAKVLPACGEYEVSVFQIPQIIHLKRRGGKTTTNMA